ncbi:MAG: NADPH-dependent oxidoreductase [Cytophagaceae bacterium]|jgi:nitroreductase|nr:NADPH-dependent oxidoreductase [Cytophagaceae bacterium]
MINTIFEHRTIRKYKNKPVDAQLLQTLLEAGTRASTTGNMQVYSIVVTTDANIKQQLMPAHFNQPMINQAPVVLTFCADFNRFKKWCIQRNAEPGYNNFISFITAAIDALLAAQNVCIAAEANGLGICYLGTVIYNADKIIETLKLPKGVVPIATVTLGYPDETPELTDRLPLEAVIHHEVYKDYTPADIDRIYAQKESMELYKSFVEENRLETLAQVFTDVRYKKSDNEYFSSVLLKTLKEQGFIE